MKNPNTTPVIYWNLCATCIRDHMMTHILEWIFYGNSFLVPCIVHMDILGWNALYRKLNKKKTKNVLEHAFWEHASNQNSFRIHLCISTTLCKTMLSLKTLLYSHFKLFSFIFNLFFFFKNQIEFLNGNFCKILLWPQTIFLWS